MTERLHPVKLMQVYQLVKEVADGCGLPIGSLHVTLREKEAAFIVTMEGGVAQLEFTVQNDVEAVWLNQLRTHITDDLKHQFGG